MFPARFIFLAITPTFSFSGVYSMYLLPLMFHTTTTSDSNSYSLRLQYTRSSIFFFSSAEPCSSWLMEVRSVAVSSSCSFMRCSVNFVPSRTCRYAFSNCGGCRRESQIWYCFFRSYPKPSRNPSKYDIGSPRIPKKSCQDRYQLPHHVAALHRD